MATSPKITHLKTKTNPINGNLNHTFKIQAEAGQKLFINIGEQSIYTNNIEFEVIEKAVQEQA